MSKRGPVLWFCLGAAFMITLAPIFAGAFAALFWSLPSDGPRDDWSAAERLVTLSGAVSNEFPIRNFYFIYMSREMDSKCFGPAMAVAHRTRNPDEAIGNISFDIERAWAERLLEARRQGAIEYLSSIPRPLLGSLDACEAHSLLAPICSAVTHAMLRRHSAELVRSFNQRKVFADARMEAERCTFVKLATMH